MGDTIGRVRRTLVILALACVGVRSTLAQRERGEIRIEVRDSQGTAVSVNAQLLSEGNQFHRGFLVGTDGRYTAQDLPFGVYRLTLTAEGFAPWTKLIEVRSEMPVRLAATLGVAPVATQVQVSGVSFPIAFSKARIFGEEVKVEVPHWGAFSGYFSFANQSRIARSPVTGGLFLGDNVSSALADTGKFAVTQDQRNTLRARLRYQAASKVWFALAGEFGSGLPAELETSKLDFNFLRSQFGAAIINQVNFDKGRVRQNFSLDASVGAAIYRKEHRGASLQLTVANLTDRVNVLNFQSLFSGTAVAAGRSASANLRLSF